jgi:uncharacterized protein YlzI (FlbEa/FlbD family)
MEFINLTDQAGGSIIVDVYNIAVVLPTDRTTVELYKGADLIVQESPQSISQKLADAKSNALK